METEYLDKDESSEISDSEFEEIREAFITSGKVRKQSSTIRARIGSVNEDRMTNTWIFTALGAGI